MNEKKKGQINISPLNIVLKLLVVIGLLGICVFLPAGSWNWPEAWIFLSLYFISITGSTLRLWKKDPELLKERMTAKRKNNVKGWDKVIIQLITLFFLFIFALAGVDAVRFGWSKVPLVVKITAYVAMILPRYLVFRVMEVNTYLSEVVRIQDDRGHRVCIEGPYRVVRHPMYIGIIFLLLCIPLALGSFYALIPAFVSICLFVVRTVKEDKMLRQELPGYEEYTHEVRYRLLPGIW